jgi:hypothetical protein
MLHACVCSGMWFYIAVAVPVAVVWFEGYSSCMIYVYRVATRVLLSLACLLPATLYDKYCLACATELHMTTRCDNGDQLFTEPATLALRCVCTVTIGNKMLASTLSL